MFKKRFLTFVAIALIMCMVLPTSVFAAAPDTEVVVLHKNLENGYSVSVTTAANDTTASPYAEDEREVSGSFDIEYQNRNGQVVSTYRVTLKGTVSRVSSTRQITSVAFSHISGDYCTASYTKTNAYTALITLTHPTLGSYTVTVTLGSGGSFTVYT